jgi:hypothetical protein
MATRNTEAITEQSTSDLGRRVKAARLANDLTLETASRLCGVSR